MSALPRDVNAIDQRLSLRTPQREALELLARILLDLDLRKETDLEAALEVVKRHAPSVSDFDRNFPSLCFALATGVGKTRLMGAFIAYLYRVHALRHFFVLAPNLTVYEKLKADFTPNTPKYVFPGLGDITERLVLITGDDWEDGRGARQGDLYADAALHVNVFNVAKINAEVRGGAAPRMKRLHEVIGDSYFDYLSKLDDLVLLMDESHRYRAQAGAKAVEGLKPILGLELTATPQVVQGSRVVPFRNVAYNYPLGNAIRDGLVKIPAVATRANFVPDGMTEDALERLKLEDGLLLHERTKAELEAYAAERDVERVKPFVLVVAESTAHAESLKQLIEGAGFMGGKYAGAVTVVHSNQTGEIRDENLARLLNVERPDEPTEIVIHVNKLGEGWDVTNLYTIIPLRAANSPNLVEQSLGRGLRLPYGRRTGVEAVDTLTVVSHDKFQSIIDHANRPGSAVQAIKTVLIDERTSTPLEVVHVKSIVEELVEASPTLVTTADRAMARIALEVATDPSSRFTQNEIRTDEGKARLVKAVQERFETAQLPIDMAGVTPDANAVIQTVVEALGYTITIPRISMVPRPGSRGAYRSFQLDMSGVRRMPVDQQILVQAMQTHERRLVAAGLPTDPGTPEQMLVRELARDNAISYDRYADLLNDLAAQMVAHLRSYLPDDEAVRNVVVTQGSSLSELIRIQMEQHRDEGAVAYDVHVSGDVHRPRELSGTSAVGAEARYFGLPVDDLSRIRLYWFTGFKRCLFTRQRFQSDTERRMAEILEHDEDKSLRWYKPAHGDLPLWLPGGAAYIPDFVVEAAGGKYLIETKADNELESPDVIAKAEAARAWCGHATEWESKNGGKPWRYLLIPDSAVNATATLAGLASKFG